MSPYRIRPSVLTVTALSLLIWSAPVAFAQHRGGGSHAGGGAVARSAPSGARTAAPAGRAYAARTAPRAAVGVAAPRAAAGAYRYGGYAAARGGVAVAGPRGVAVAGPRGVAVAGPRGAAVATTRYGGAYYGARYYGGYGYHYVAPVHYVAPYYHFRPWYGIGFGITIGYPFAWSYPYYYPAYYPYPYPYAYPYPYGAPYGAAPYGATSTTPYPAYGSAYPPADYPAAGSTSQYPTGTTGSVGVQHAPNQQNSGGISFEITPAAAELSVDGVHVGTVGQFNPQSQPLGLSAGRHHLEIKAPGYQTINIDADIVAGQVIPYQGTMQR
jgi:hypothetical protein